MAVSPTAYCCASCFKDDQNRDIHYIFAPDVNNNSDLGPGGTVRYFCLSFRRYPVVRDWPGRKRISRAMVDLTYETGRQRNAGGLSTGDVFFERDPTERFFGIGNDSRLGEETNYTTEQVYVKGLFGWNITKQLAARRGVTTALRADSGRRIHDSIPQTTTMYPNVKGINGGSEVYNEMRMTYDNRDSIDIPRKGGLALLYAGFADRRFMSSVSYNRFGGELRHYWSFWQAFHVCDHAILQ